MITAESWAEIWPVKLIYLLFAISRTSTAVGSVVGDLLSIVALIVCGGFVIGPFFFVVQDQFSILSSLGEERAGCFTLNVFSVSYGC